MSAEDIENLYLRFRSEVKRLGSIAETSRRIGEKSPVGLRDVCKRRKRLTAELLMRVAALGVDSLYVITGQRVSTRLDLSPVQRALLDSFDRCSPQTRVEALQVVSLLAHR